MDAFRRALALQPDHSNANVQLARLLVAQGKGAEALPHLQRVGAEKAEDPALLALYGRALAAAKQYEGAEQAFTSALRQRPESLELRVALGLTLLQAGKRDRAAEILQSVAQQHPRDPHALLALAQARLARKELAQALAVLGEARRHAPDHPAVLELLARTASDLGFHNDAALAWSEYLKLVPSATYARRERAFALVRAKDAKGLPELEAYAKAFPTDAIAMYQLGVAYAPTDSGKALEQLDRALKTMPDNPDALYVRGALLAREGRTEEARRDLERSVKLNPANAPALSRLGLLYRTAGDLRSAETTLRRASELDPHDRAALMHLGFVLRAQGRLAEAEPLFARLKAQLSAPRSSTRAGLLEFLNLDPERQREEYLANLRKAVEDRPEDQRLRLQLGMEQLASGDVAGAMRNFEGLSQAEALREAAEALIDAGEYQGALRLPGERTQSAERLVAQARLASDLQGAVQAMNGAIALAPERAFVYRQAYRLLVGHQRFNEAASLLEQAVRRVPEDRNLRLEYATALELSKRFAHAREVLAGIHQRWPEWSRPYLVHAISFMTRGKAAEGMPLLERALALGENSAEVHYYHALALTELSPDNRVRALEAVGRALEMSPEDPFALALAGRIAINNNQHARALELLEKSLKLRPGEAETHYQRLRALNALGRKEEARAEAEVVRKLRATEGGTPPSAGRRP